MLVRHFVGVLASYAAGTLYKVYMNEVLHVAAATFNRNIRGFACEALNSCLLGPCFTFMF